MAIDFFLVYIKDIGKLITWMLVLEETLWCNHLFNLITTWWNFIKSFS